MTTAQAISPMPSDREAQIITFLHAHGAGAGRRQPIAGDASFRRYERIFMPDESTYILMDAPPEHEDVRPFVRVLHILKEYGYSPPKLLAASEEEGLLLLEDFGEGIYGKLLAEDASCEHTLYHAAIALLADMANKPQPEGVPVYTDDLLMREVELFTEWYLPHHPVEVTEAAKKELLHHIKALLPQARQVPEALVLRDYHAENLLWLGDRSGHQKVGLLDFQDAVIGPVSYDLVSLLEDARRDVPPELAENMLDAYLDLQPDMDPQALRASYAIMGAQRNLKIIGIFSRLAFRDGKPRYLTLLPRVWGYLRRDLQSPALAVLATWFATYFPEDAQEQLPRA